MTTTRRKDVALPGNGGQFATYEAAEAPATDLMVVAQPLDVDDLWGDTSPETAAAVDTTDATTAVEDHTDTTDATDWDVEVSLENPDKPSTVDWDDPEQLKQLMKTARQVARSWGTKRGAIDNGMDVDDIAQEAITAVLKLRASGKDTSIRDLYGYVNRAAANIASRAGRRVRSEDLAAYRVYRERLNELTTVAGRELSTAEKDQVAQQIRDNWEDRNHRPSPEFRNNVQGWEKVRSAGMTDEVFDMTVSINGSVDTGNYVAPDSHLDKALSFIDGDAEGTKRSARKFLWNAIAENAPGAPIIEPHLGHRAVTATLAQIKTEDEFKAALEDWGNGIDTPATEALMAPWSNKDIRDQASAVNVLEGKPEYAFDLWQTAVTAAARPRNTQKVA